MEQGKEIRGPIAQGSDTGAAGSHIQEGSWEMGNLGAPPASLKLGLLGTGTPTRVCLSSSPHLNVTQLQHSLPPTSAAWAQLSVLQIKLFCKPLKTRGLHTEELDNHTCLGDPLPSQPGASPPVPRRQLTGGEEAPSPCQQLCFMKHSS